MSEFEKRTAYVALGVKRVNGQTKLYVSGAYWDRAEAVEHARLYERLKTCDPYLTEVNVRVPVGDELLDSDEMLSAR